MLWPMIDGLANHKAAASRAMSRANGRSRRTDCPSRQKTQAAAADTAVANTVT